MTILNRSAPDAPPTLVLTATEIGVIDRLVHDKPKLRQKTLSHYLIKIVRRPAIPSCGAGCHASPTSRWAPWSEENLWIIQKPVRAAGIIASGSVYEVAD
ncbi:hypothetical protein [Bradyrhizobium sp. RT11b]|uniref:hypothetical protein n=1 Tax=Bradyrhizobium sp. RT11b TaxID=3156332 RepID=UPI0033907C9F